MLLFFLSFPLFHWQMDVLTHPHFPLFKSSGV